MRFTSQFKAESQNIKRKYDELTKEGDAQSGKLKKFLQGLSCKVEGGQTAARELRAFEMAAESDILLQSMVLLYLYSFNTIPGSITTTIYLVSVVRMVA